MPNRLFVYPYNLSSKSATYLSEALDTRRIRVNGTYRWRPGHRIINWGNSRIANWMSPGVMTHVLNKPVQIGLASNKTCTFSGLQSANVPIPDWTIHKNVAEDWLRGNPKYQGLKHAVLCRTLTRANSGRGIVVAETPEELVPAPLYTRYVPKTHEYRVHVFKEFGVIDVQQKRRSSAISEDERDPYIRNHDAGWVFCREDVHPPQVVLQAAINSVMALGLDFGAVDVGHHPTIGVCVYEVNTAPGLEGQTLVNYAETFKHFL